MDKKIAQLNFDLKERNALIKATKEQLEYKKFENKKVLQDEKNLNTD